MIPFLVITGVQGVVTVSGCDIYVAENKIQSLSDSYSADRYSEELLLRVHDGDEQLWGVSTESETDSERKRYLVRPVRVMNTLLLSCL